MIYLLGNAPVQAWLKSPDLRRETCGSLVLYLPPSPKRDVLILAMKDIDERLAAAKNFKHGQKTRAAFITLPDGSECFGKSVQIAKMRLENRFRYVVAPTRGLWAAAVAQRLREIGVPTPEVWGAGERRPRLFPTVSYLFTVILRVTQLDVWLRNSDALMDEAERILPRLGRMIGRLHGGRITHNDLKPENVYLSADEEPGLWDLDPAKIHRDAIPLEARAFEFSRIVAGMLAAELGANEKIAKRAGLLHDIGKAVDQTQEGTHIQLGVELASRYGEKPEVIHAIEAHHDDVVANTIEAVLVKVADAISAGRPGARRDTLEIYIKRLQKIEEIVNSYEGIKQSFAVQAGREVRIIVQAEMFDDLASGKLARDVAKRIENELDYPGQIRVTVVREFRTTEIAK